MTSALRFINFNRVTKLLDMAQYIAYNGMAEVNGPTIMSVLKGMPGYEQKALGILEKEGIVNLTEDGWYSQQAWLNAFKQIAEKIGSGTIRTIGTKIVESAQWPPHVNSLETALGSIDVAYHMNHRISGNVLFNPETGKMSEGIGHYTSEKISDNEFRISCENPYPCDFDKGLLKGVVERFKPAGKRVEFLENVKSGCRNQSAHKCTYYIKIH